MSDIYAARAGVYEAAGLGDASEALRQRLFDKIQMEGWLGRRILELGCGIGRAACWFSMNGFRVTAIDQSPAMLAQARQRAEGQGVVVDWREADMRQASFDKGYDLVLALDTFNELSSIRDLEAVFQKANAALQPGKLLLFDLVTLQGLAEQWGNADRVLYDDRSQLLLLVRSQYSFETMANTRHYILYQQVEGAWQRADEVQVVRGFALQAVGALLQRNGFKIDQVVNPALEPFDPTTDRTGQAIFLATKVRDL
ncbi:MAG: class I SAM-dependent methyltransferase [Anaerolineae bacterium]|nr:class I SAM-dependent methyltransferase [Anaerolineae bacterium]